jgi:GTP-binding protein
MEVKSAEFLVSNTHPKECPEPKFPEYAFIGRSNVGKSSLINMLCDRKNLAKTSGTPGKTQLINHFLINENIYLVDLPGYGYAKASKKERVKWDQFTLEYLNNRPNLLYTFVLLDSRHKAQQIDLDFMQMLGESHIPFVMVYTKIDKLSSSALQKNLAAYQKEMRKGWAELPKRINTSATGKLGKDEIWDLIEQTNLDYSYSYH